MAQCATISLVRTRSTASHFASGKDAFHCVPKIPQANEWDAVERVLTI